jgi:hypothetical protein
MAAGEVFPDISGHWAEKYISALTEKGGINGMPDGKFHPNDTVTFPQYIKIVIGCEYGEIAPVEGGDWASGFLQKALDTGIIDTDDIGNTGPITRNDAARIVAASLTQIYAEEAAPDTDIVSRFSDYPSCKSCRTFFHEVVGECYVKGIITGKPGPIFDGEANLTRAEACIIIMKMIDPSLRTPPAPADAGFYEDQ